MKKARTKTSTPYEPDERDLSIYYEYTRTKKYLAEIGKDYHISGSRVAQIVKKITAYVYPEMRDKVNSLRVLQTDRLEAIFEEAMFAWQHSKNDTITSKESGKYGQEIIRKTNSGDPRHLAEAMKALADIRRIWGADEPEKIEVTGEIRAAGKPISQYRQEIRARLQQALDDMGDPEMN